LKTYPEGHFFLATYLMPTPLNDAPIQPAPSRLPSLDWLRGVVMVLMFVDHVRDYIHAESIWHSPTDLSVISSATFLTRWITHLCAPLFFLLAGLSAYLQLRRGKDLPALSRFLWTRGLWLVVCEFTLVRVGSSFTWNYGAYLGTAQVIWALGISMIFMAGLIRLPMKWILAFSLVLICGHNLLDGIHFTLWKGPGTAVPGFGSSVWILLHEGSEVIFPFGAKSPLLYVAYPILPWPAVMSLGFAMGPVFTWEAERRKRFLWRGGCLCLSVFMLLRALGYYGDPSPWSHQVTGFRTVLSFLNTTKYPPSLLYLLMTLGPGWLLLAWREGRTEHAVDRILTTFGRVPFFFYVLQWPMAMCLGLLFHRFAGKSSGHLLGGLNPAADAGFSLWGVYGAWAIGLLALYPLCRWFAEVKRRRNEAWLSYL
jgi:uncharacterized membrane protein